MAALCHNSNVTPDHGALDLAQAMAPQVCTEQGWPVGPVSRDFASGLRKDRPELRSLLNAARDGRFDVPSLGTTHALSGNATQHFESLEILEASGVAVYDPSSMAKLETGVPIAFLAVLDRALKQERRRKALAGRSARK